MSDAAEENDHSSRTAVLAHIQAALQGNSELIRLGAIAELLEQKFSSPAILKTLEYLSLKDKRLSVRKAAQQALNSPTHRYIHSRITIIKKKERQTILAEITDWESQGLIDNNQAHVIRRRYDFDLKPTQPEQHEETPKGTIKMDAALVNKAPKAATQAETARPSLTGALLSESSIKIALYLGAFFVITAAAILTAIVEASRLPILLVATTLFAGGAIALRKRLPNPSFALFIVFSFLLPTDANVLADVLNLSDPANSGYWFGVMALMALIWGYSAWVYSSRLFSVAAFIALIVSVTRLGETLDVEPEVYLILLSLTTILGLGATLLLKRWQSEKFSLPLFISAQLAQITLGVYALIVIAIRTEDTTTAWNVVSALFWLTVVGFYILSNFILPFGLFPWLAGAALFPVPIVLMMAFDVKVSDLATVVWIWGLILVIASEYIRRVNKIRTQPYGLPVLIISIPVLMTAMLIGFSEANTLGFTFALASTILYTLLQILKPRWYVWGTALFLALVAFFSFFDLPFMKDINVSAGVKFLASSILLLLPDLFFKPDFSTNKSWHWPLRIFGSLIVIFNFSIILPLVEKSAGNASIAYSIYALLFIAYTWRFKIAWIGYLATASAAFSLTFALQHYDLEIWQSALTGLALVYFITGWLINKPAEKLSNVLRYSGIGLASLVSLIAGFTVEEGELAAAIPPALSATMFTVEAYLRRNVWLGFPANLLYLMAYFMLLVGLNVDEPQFFSIAIAALGLLMHYLLIRAGSRTGAFITGMGSQIILFSTTYIQFISTERSIFFWVIFLQTLVVIVYGSVIRSRSLVVTPLVFLVLSIITGLYGFLEGFLPVVVIGCTGLALLLLGIFAVILRERIKQFSDRFNDWGA
ncbi:MAG: hypothetical protein QGD96_03565 [Anaerolineae bacterium]|nr:hypothetical protein [Anaerolineae bacterium]